MRRRGCNLCDVLNPIWNSVPENCDESLERFSKIQGHNPCRSITGSYAFERHDRESFHFQRRHCSCAPLNGMRNVGDLSDVVQIRKAPEGKDSLFVVWHGQVDKTCDSISAATESGHQSLPIDDGKGRFWRGTLKCLGIGGSR